MRIPIICELACGLISREFAKTHFLSSTLYTYLCRCVKKSVQQRARGGKLWEGPGYRQWLRPHSRLSQTCLVFRAQLEKCTETAQWSQYLPNGREAAVAESNSKCSSKGVQCRPLNLGSAHSSTLMLAEIHNLPKTQFSCLQSADNGA